MQIDVQLELFENSQNLEPFFTSGWRPATLQHGKNTTLLVPIDHYRITKCARIHVRYPKETDVGTPISKFGLHCISKVYSMLACGDANNPFHLFPWWSCPYSPSLCMLLANERDVFNTDEHVDEHVDESKQSALTATSFDQNATDHERTEKVKQTLATNRKCYTESCDDMGYTNAVLQICRDNCLLSFSNGCLLSFSDGSFNIKDILAEQDATFCVEMAEQEAPFCVEITLESLTALVYPQRNRECSQ